MTLKSHFLLFILLTYLSSMTSLAAQQIHPSGIYSGVHIHSNSNGMISSVVGDLAILPLESGNNASIGQGFLASATSLKVTPIHSVFAEHELHIFPNPSSEEIHIQLAFPHRSALSIDVRRTDGISVFCGEIISGQTSFVITASHWSTGTYVLTLAQKGNLVLGSYVISHL
ncbi:MAG: T9SS type A sorting domain-containing protein [Saprospiraceae bacterium]|nr:T9SS type A sorting domain-containing protein [Saprospiraceae bacterium]